MALNYPISADNKADMLAVVLPDGWVYMLMGNTTRGDQPPVFYQYISSSTATDDGNNVLTPTALIGSPGRYIKTKLSYNDLANMLFLATVALSGAYSDLTGRPSLAAVATSGAYSDLSGKPALATVATSGVYADLSAKPSIPAAQIQSDWTQASSGALDFVKNKPSIPSAQQAYEGTTLRAGAFPIIKSATVSSGVAVFNLTADGTAGGTALFPTGVIQDSINLFVNDATAAYQMAVVFSNSNKTVTITANKLTTANILTGILGQISANGAVIKLQIWGY